jgi:hypothetical protein
MGTTNGVGGKGHQRLKQRYMRTDALQPQYVRKETKRVYKTGLEKFLNYAVLVYEFIFPQ